MKTEYQARIFKNTEELDDVTNDYSSKGDAVAAAKEALSRLPIQSFATIVKLEEVAKITSDMTFTVERRKRGR